MPRRLTVPLLAVISLGSTATIAVPPYQAPAPYPPWQSPGGWYPPPFRVAPPTWFAPPHRRPVVATPAVPAEPASPQSSEKVAPTRPIGRDDTAGTTEPGKSTAAGQSDRKTAFLARLRPMIENENTRLLQLRSGLSTQVEALNTGRKLPDAQQRHLRSLAREYRVDGDPLTDAQARDELLRKIDIIPTSLALAQAANESAWGQSRFAREGNNLFGIWTYDASKGIVPLRRAAGKKHLVRRFDSEADSVRYYMFTLNSHPAYRTLRALRAQHRRDGLPLDGLSLVDGLTAYSAKGEDYVRLIRSLIERLDLAVYDAAPRDQA